MFINIHFIILVVSNRTVQTSKSILRILSGSEVIVSEIIKQTSSDRSHVLDILENLSKAGLIQQIKDPKHKQKKINKLTSLGVEYSRLIIDMEHFHKCYSNFDRCIKENLAGDEFLGFSPDDSDDYWGYFGVSTNKLKSRGWSKEERRCYEDLCVGADNVLRSSHTNILLALIYQYLLINRRDDMTNLAKILLNEIIIGEIRALFPIVEAYMLDYYPGDDTNKVTNFNLTKKLETYNTIANLTSFISKIYTHPSKILDNRFLGNDLEKLLISLVKLSNPTLDSLDYEIGDSGKPGLSLRKMLDLKGTAL